MSSSRIMSTPYRPPVTRIARRNCFQPTEVTPVAPDMADVDSFPTLHDGTGGDCVWRKQSTVLKDNSGGTVQDVWWETAPPGWMLLTPNWGGSGLNRVFRDYGGDSENEAVIRSEELRQQWLRDPTRRHIQRMREKEDLLADIGDITPCSVTLFQQRVEYEPPELSDDDSAGASASSEEE